jgi:hypothetical protein
MLTEIVNLSDTSPGLRRRWFTDADMDLYVWYDRHNQPVEFQLCYDKRSEERALAWDSETGLSHHHVDTGEARPDNAKQTALMLENTSPDINRAKALFSQSGQTLDHNLFEFILARLTLDYPD